MKVLGKRTFKYPLTNCTTYYFSTGHELNVHDTGRSWGYTPSHKICATKVQKRMEQKVSQWEDGRLQTTSWDY